MCVGTSAKPFRVVLKISRFQKTETERDCKRALSSDPTCKDDNARFTTVPMKSKSD